MCIGVGQGIALIIERSPTKEPRFPGSREVSWVMTLSPCAKGWNTKQFE
jgi:hypothetical protein